MTTYRKTTKPGPFHISNPIFLYTILIILAIICILPLYLALVNGTRSDTSIGQSPLSLFPGLSFFKNHKILMDGGYNIWQAFLNSMEVTIPYTLIATYFSTLAGYSFAKHEYKGRRVLFSIVLLTLMIPTQLGFIGYYDLMDQFDWIDSYYPLILPALHSGTFIFFTKQYIETSVNNELIEAARVDGASDFYIFNRIVFPLASPAIATMAIFTFVGQWNSLLSPLIILTSQEKFTMPLFIAKLRDPTIGAHDGAIYLALGLSIVPLLIAFIFLSKYIIKGNTEGGVKG